VNFDEEAAEEVIRILTEKNVGVEIGISSIDEAEKFSKSKLAEKCLRVLIEPMEKNTTETDKIVSEIETVLDKNNILLPRLLHGFNELAWHLIKSSVIKGYSTRIGFEDTLFLPNGKIANSNAELVKEAFKILKS
jgi:uncharacterized protein (DUF849 family)